MIRQVLWGIFASLLMVNTQAWAAGPNADNIRVSDIVLEPIAQGKNVLCFKAENFTDEPQCVSVNVYTRSPRFGQSGMGWGTTFNQVVPAHKTNDFHWAYKIQGPITEDTLVRLRFYNPKSLKDVQVSKVILNRQWLARDLKQRQEPSSQPADGDEVKGLSEALAYVQSLLAQGKYTDVWPLFTQDYQQAEWQLNPSVFGKAMNGDKPDCIFHWDKKTFLSLQPKDCVKVGGGVRQTISSSGQQWRIDWKKDSPSGLWKIDWIEGNVSIVASWKDWQSRVLPQMAHRTSDHFDLYCPHGSAAERDADKILSDRETAYSSIAKRIDTPKPLRLTLVFFETQESKFLVTGHQGMGAAFDHVLVEVYNEKQRLDPVHETAHALMAVRGFPPPAFNEGFAVYMSECLGYHPLENLGGSQFSLQQKISQVKLAKQWIPLVELLSYENIGSQGGKTPVAYAEAGWLVKRLIECYGMEKFLRGYDLLASQPSNRVAAGIQQAWGISLPQLEQELLRDPSSN